MVFLSEILTVPRTVPPSIVNGRLRVLKLPKVVSLAYHPSKICLTLKVIAEPLAVHPARPPQVNLIGGDVLNVSVRSITSRVTDISVIVAVKPPVCGVVLVDRICGGAGIIVRVPADAANVF